MADQGIWWKLWCSALSDPKLDSLDIADFGRFCKIGAYVKLQGNSGQLVITPPARSLCSMLQVNDFNALKCALEEMPNLIVSGETSLTVTFKNWSKYQGDFSTLRVRKFRQMKRSKRRREEKRGEVKENRRDIPPINPPKFFIKPTAQEVETYGIEINYKILGTKFVDHYEMKGWKIGQNPMKSWKAAVRTWKQREIEGGTYHAPDGSKGVSKWAAIARANREAEELRKRETTHEQISPRVGNLSPLTPEARADQ